MSPTLNQMESFELGDSSSCRGRVLLLHGFTGSPWEMRPLGESLAARGFYVHCPRFLGHGANAEAMLWVTSEDWCRQAQKSFEKLAEGENVFVCGLSMGALISILLAARNPRQIRRLSLLAPAVELSSFSARVLSRFKLTQRAASLHAWVDKGESDIEDEEVRKTTPRQRKFPTVRLTDFFELQKNALEVASRIDLPVQVISSRQDHVVTAKGIRKLTKTLTNVSYIELSKGFHILPQDLESARVCAEVSQFFEK